MIYIEQYDCYIDDDCVVYRIAKCNSFGRKAGQLYQLKPYFDTDGYKYYSYNVNGKSVCPKHHRLVALAFVPNPENKQTVDHINRNKLDNRPCNLRWATMSEQEANKDRTEKARALHNGCKCKNIVDGKHVPNDETREHNRIHYALHVDRYRERDRERYRRCLDKRKKLSMDLYNRNMQTKRRVLFCDGSHHWIPVEKALELFKLSTKERIWISK